QRFAVFEIIDKGLKRDSRSTKNGLATENCRVSGNDAHRMPSNEAAILLSNDRLGCNDILYLGDCTPDGELLYARASPRENSEYQALFAPDKGRSRNKAHGPFEDSRCTA